eukprot:629977-Pelagomonas_calceolata.AAC.6
MKVATVWVGQGNDRLQGRVNLPHLAQNSDLQGFGGVEVVKYGSKQTKWYHVGLCWEVLCFSQSKPPCCYLNTLGTSAFVYLGGPGGHIYVDVSNGKQGLPPSRPEPCTTITPSPGHPNTIQAQIQTVSMQSAAWAARWRQRRKHCRCPRLRPISSPGVCTLWRRSRIVGKSLARVRTTCPHTSMLVSGWTLTTGQRVYLMKLWAEEPAPSYIHTKK